MRHEGERRTDACKYAWDWPHTPPPAAASALSASVCLRNKSQAREPTAAPTPTPALSTPATGRKITTRDATARAAGTPAVAAPRKSLTRLDFKPLPPCVDLDERGCCDPEVAVLPASVSPAPLTAAPPARVETPAPTAAVRQKGHTIAVSALKPTPIKWHYHRM
mmetsp:Transcript_55383/g.108414  ORF Transcript_55383/g.108414 Transcript_55383/m.108414 type:complete len:164 (+) Transcript_55383:884-1375(+)